MKIFLCMFSLFFLISCQTTPTRNKILKSDKKDLVLKSFEKQKDDNKVIALNLWQSSNFLFSDRIALKKGDIVTVIISETATADRSLSTTKQKTNSIQAGATAMLGYGKSLTAKNKNFSPSTMLDLSSSNDFSGSGTTTNSDNFSAKIAAIVTKIFPNGNMAIFGRKELIVNNQPQILEFEGIIRPSDVSSSNTISSDKVAASRVNYGGGGSLAQSVEEGWLSQILGRVLPF